MIAAARGTPAALAAGAAGAALLTWAGAPAAALVGSTVAVTALALLGGRPSVPAPLRDAAFATIGLTLGSGVTPDLMSDIARWPLSLVAMLVVLGALMAVSAWSLRALFGFDRATSLLATSPGALSYALVLASDGRADLRAVTVLQGMRLFAITVLVPPLVAWGGGEGPAPSAAAPAGVGASLLLLAVACAASLGLARLRVPAAFLLGGLAVSGAAHALGWVEGRPSPIVTASGFTVAGAVIGARFAGFGRGELRAMLVAGGVTSALAVALSFLLSWPVALWLGLPHGQVWVAFAPGGVEGMAAIGFSLGYDPVYVATHHIVRLLALFAVLPLLTRRAAGVPPRDRG